MGMFVFLGLLVLTSSCYGQSCQGTYQNPSSSGTGWTKVEGEAKQIDVGTDIVLAISMTDQIYYGDPITASQPAGTSWVQLESFLKHITVSPSGAVWGVNSENQEVVH